MAIPDLTGSGSLLVSENIFKSVILSVNDYLHQIFTNTDGDRVQSHATVFGEHSASTWSLKNRENWGKPRVEYQAIYACPMLSIPSFEMKFPKIHTEYYLKFHK